MALFCGFLLPAQAAPDLTVFPVPVAAVGVGCGVGVALGDSVAEFNETTPGEFIPEAGMLKMFLCEIRI